MKPLVVKRFANPKSKAVEFTDRLAHLSTFFLLFRKYLDIDSTSRTSHDYIPWNIRYYVHIDSPDWFKFILKSSLFTCKTRNIA